MSTLEKFDDIASLSGRSKAQADSGGWVSVAVESASQLTDVLRLAAENKVWVIRGRPERYATRLLSAIPAGSSEVVFVDLAGMSRILEHVPEDQVISLEAGVNLATLDEHLADHGQWLPARLEDKSLQVADLADSGDGGYLETMYAGASSLILGMSVALSSGDCIRSGGKIVKNVTGFNLGRLFIGSRGWLGIPYSFHLRLYSRPETRKSVMVGAGDRTRLIDLAAKLLATGLPLSCLELFDGRLLASLTDSLASTASGGDAADRLAELLEQHSENEEACFALLCVDGQELVVGEIASEVDNIIQGAGLRSVSLPADLAWQLPARVWSEKTVGRETPFLELSLSLRGIRYLMQTWWLESGRPVWHCRPGCGRLRLIGENYTTMEKWLDSLKGAAGLISQDISVAFPTAELEHAVRRLEFCDDTGSDTRAAAHPGTILGALKSKFDPAGVMNPLVEFREPGKERAHTDGTR